MKVAYFVFPRITLLDFVGCYDALRRVATMKIGTLEQRIVGSTEEIVDESGFRFRADGVYEDLSAFDLLVVPGGFGTRELAEDARCIEWLRGWGDARPIASVCTGSILLGAAGHLRGLRATTHHAQYDLLRPWCREVVEGARVVDEGRVVTAGGVTCALDLGLHLVDKFFGADARGRIAKQMQMP
jgi:transcriptional regulator GlxA family with amidase domain